MTTRMQTSTLLFKLVDGEEDYYDYQDVDLNEDQPLTGKCFEDTEKFKFDHIVVIDVCSWLLNVYYKEADEPYNKQPDPYRFSKKNRIHIILILIRIRWIRFVK